MIDKFEDEFWFLSNFFEPCPIEDRGLVFNSVEAAYQAAKTTDLKLAEEFTKLRAGPSKKKGKVVPLRPDWESVKIDIMEKLLRQKFAPGTELAEKLLATGSAELVEGNTWRDFFWGVCNGVGLNHLGKLLMKIRQDLKEISG